MKVYLLDRVNGELVDSKIVPAKLEDMKTITDGWEFNWRKHYSLPNSKAFKITTTLNPTVTEGLMIFQLLDEEPFMAYLEAAPSNRFEQKKFDYVAGCLIAKACYLSIIEGKDYHKGFLSFHAINEELISLYHNKYGAVRVGDTLMYIDPKKGEDLIQTYLFREKKI